MKPGELKSLARRLARLRLVDEERDLIERLDLVDLAAGNVRRAATSAPDEASALVLVEALRRITAGLLEHDVRVVPDDRPARLAALGAPGFVVRAIAARPQPLRLAVSWRTGEPAPRRGLERLRVGPFLGYPPCCVRYEEARRARIVLAEAEGMLETWGARSTAALLAGIDTRRPFLVDDAGDDATRVERLRMFPFVSFVPCVRCCERGSRSPAGREDSRRRLLARSLAASLERRIARVRGFEAGV